MNFDDYQIQARDTSIYPEKISIIYPLLGLVSEAGEVAGKIKKILRDSNSIISEEDRLKITDELGDVLWYLAIVADDLDISFEYVAKNNLDKLKDRKDRDVLSGSGDDR